MFQNSESWICSTKPEQTFIENSRFKIQNILLHKSGARFQNSESWICSTKLEQGVTILNLEFAPLKWSNVSKFQILNLLHKSGAGCNNFESWICSTKAEQGFKIPNLEFAPQKRSKVSKLQILNLLHKSVANLYRKFKIQESRICSTKVEKDFKIPNLEFAPQKWSRV